MLCGEKNNENNGENQENDGNDGKGDVDRVEPAEDLRVVLRRRRHSLRLQVVTLRLGHSSGIGFCGKEVNALY